MTPNTPSASRGGAVFLFMMGLFLLLLGSGFCWLLWSSFSRASATRTWAEVEARVTSSRPEDRQLLGANKEFRWHVAYRYYYEGKEYVSKLHTPRGSKWGQHRSDVDECVEKYPEGLSTICFVNPALPEIAILEHDTKAAGYSIWFPALFAVGGLGIMVGATRSFSSITSGKKI